MKRNQLIALSLLLIVAWSCKNDDDGLLDAEVIPPRTLSDVAATDDVDIRAFLETHTYNYEEFENPPADFDFRVKLSTIDGENSGKTPLIDLMQTETISVKSEDVGRNEEEGEVVDHKLYFLEVVQGKGEKPIFAARTITNYEGSLLDGTLFDGRSVPTSQYLPFSVRGYSKGIQKLIGGTGFVENDNGTVTFSDFGVGLMVIPSGLAYFDKPPQTAPLIKPYSPLVFSVNLLDVEQNADFDGDGIPSILEDLNGDGNLNNDNTDEEIEVLSRVYFPNHNDTDDDQDGILTIDEIELDADGNFVGFKDSDGDGVHDHLDSDS